jgi:hypothetical protein
VPAQLAADVSIDQVMQGIKIELNVFLHPKRPAQRSTTAQHRSFGNCVLLTLVWGNLGQSTASGAPVGPAVSVRGRSGRSPQAVSVAVKRSDHVGNRLACCSTPSTTQ